MPFLMNNRTNADAKNFDELEVSIFIQGFRLAAIQAGCVANRLQSEVHPMQKTTYSTPEASALTAVDLATQDVILYLLHSILPEIAVDAEEDTGPLSLFPSYKQNCSLVVIDPLDGTLNYTLGLKEYAVMGALISKNIYQASVVYFPVWGEMYWAIRGKGAWKSSKIKQEAMLQVQNSSNKVLITPYVSEASVQALSKMGLEPVVSRCSAVDALAPVMGCAVASISENPIDRRRAIGMLITTEARGSLMLDDQFWHGEDPECFNKRSCPNIVAVSKDLATRIRQELTTD